MSTLVIFLSNLAGYLPYGLKFKCDNPTNFAGIKLLNEVDYDYPIDKFRPILIPLSRFKDINSEFMSNLNLDVLSQIALSEFANQRVTLDLLPFGLVQECYRNHIDIFNLIPHNLAVEKL